MRLLFAFLALTFLTVCAASDSPLKVGFYLKTCPHAEAIVRRTIIKAVSRNPKVAPSLVRMHFHDCFIRGCDASVLLDSKPQEPAEKEHPVNNPSIIGFDVIDEAKAKIEALCPGTVSCADILAFAARDSAYITGLHPYTVLAGRRDGRVSNESEVVQQLPPPFFNTTQLEQNFARKGMTVDDLVVLSGAHSLGVSDCSKFTNRLYSFNETHKQDPTLDAKFAKMLKARCPKSSSRGMSTVPLDETPRRLDNVYYKNLIHNKGVLTSDQELFSGGDPSMARLVSYYARYPSKWATKFAAAMVRMGSIDVITGTRGEIRYNCREVNH